MQLGFIDFSKEERNKVLATLQLLGQKTALDELGIGVVRDAYADILFPGISTIQTRAKYFVLIPYIFAKAEKQSYSRNREVLEWINKFEDKLVGTMVNNNKTKQTGIIGSVTAQQKKVVKMKPSGIYWNGLRTFEIIKNNKLSITNACNIIMDKAKKLKMKSVKLDGETFDDPNANNDGFVLFSPILPEYDLEKETSIDLTRCEAVFLSDKIINAQNSKKSLLAFLIKQKVNFTEFDKIDTTILPEKIKSDYLLAKDFADFIYGAHLRYNIIFSNYEDADMLQRFEYWKTGSDFKTFDIKAIFNRITCNYCTRKFCEDFFSYIENDEMDRVDTLIIAREQWVKRDRAKINKLDEYHYDPVHDYKLNFRFGTATRIIDDIIKGLKVHNGKNNV